MPVRWEAWWDVKSLKVECDDKPGNAARFETAENWFAARVHLRRMGQLASNDEPVQSRLAHAESALPAEKTSLTP